MSATADSPASTNAKALPASILVAGLAGVLVSIQGIFNGAFTASGAGPLLAGWISYIGTFLTVLVIMAAQGNLRRFYGILRTEGRWWWFGVGAGGVPIVIAMAWGIPLVGATIASVCAVAGQTIMGLILDRFGVGLPQKIHFSGRRVAAATVVLIGLGLAIGAGGSGTLKGWAMVGAGLLIFVGCSSITFQNAGNGAVTSRSGYPLIATFTSVAGGAAIMSVVVLAAFLLGSFEGLSFPGVSDWWMYLGGPAGTGIVFCAAWSVRHLGTFRLALAMVSGQLLTAMVVDSLMGVPISLATVISSLAVLIATFLAAGTKSSKPSSPSTTENRNHPGRHNGIE